MPTFMIQNFYCHRAHEWPLLEREKPKRRQIYMSKSAALLCAIAVAGSIGYAAGETTGTQAMAPRMGDAASTIAARRSELMNEAYKAAGVSEENIKKLNELNAKSREARAKGEQERRKLITPEQEEKFRDYMREHGGAMRRPGGGGWAGPGASAQKNDDKKAEEKK
jgi:hypothetical protein